MIWVLIDTTNDTFVTLTFTKEAMDNVIDSLFGYDRSVGEHRHYILRQFTSHDNGRAKIIETQELDS